MSTKLPAFLLSPGKQACSTDSALDDARGRKVGAAHAGGRAGPVLSGQTPLKTSRPRRQKAGLVSEAR